LRLVSELDATSSGRDTQRVCGSNASYRERPCLIRSSRWTSLCTTATVDSVPVSQVQPEPRPALKSSSTSTDRLPSWPELFAGRGMEKRTLKSFRLYLSRRAVAPRRVVADYQPEELARFREEFQPVAECYRRHVRIAYALMVPAGACIILCWAFPAVLSWFMMGFFACWLSLLVLAFLSPVLDCPACQNALDQGIGAYCPECGAHALQRGDWFRAPCCSSCRRKIQRGKGRHYTIRSCTQCGVPLDARGI
jgi:hypothetical protein